MYRARGKALKLAFADSLKGMEIAEYSNALLPKQGIQSDNIKLTRS